MEINLVTKNLGKVKEFKTILGDSVRINHISMEYKELRSDDSEEIAKDAAKRLAEELKKPIVSDFLLWAILGYLIDGRLG